MKKIKNKWKILIVIALIAAIIPISIFAGSGDTNTVQYNAANRHINGTYAEPVREGYVFKGWATTKEKADAGQVDFYGNPEDISNSSLTSIKDGETKHVYAVWGQLKYAVQLYGIGQDVDENGKAMGLTFGPATGANYTSSSKSHTPDGNDENGNPHRCLHNDDWKTIIEWNEKDPYVYEQCIDNNCTHSVNLTPTKAQVGVLFANNYADYCSTGDGPGMLYNELIDDKSTNTSNNTGSSDATYKYRNLQYNGSYSTSGGYGASRIRAILNGKDEHTGPENVTGGGINAYTADTCLLAAFPKELQEAIGKKAVHYATSYQAYDSDNEVYDKLWLFSNKEIYGEIPSTYGSNYGKYFNYTSEGNQYQRTADMGLEAHTGWSYKNQNKLESYHKTNNSASNIVWWLRSLCGGSNYHASHVSDYGYLGDRNVGDDYGVAPGFVLER